MEIARISFSKVLMLSPPLKEEAGNQLPTRIIAQKNSPAMFNGRIFLWLKKTFHKRENIISAFQLHQNFIGKMICVVVLRRNKIDKPQ